MKKIFLIAAAFLAVATSACAWPNVPGVYGTPTVPTAPVLRDVQVNFGLKTVAKMGGVNFASQDVVSYGFAFYGIDMWDGNGAHTPVKWTIRDKDNTGKWDLNEDGTCENGPVTVNSGTASTPVPCSTSGTLPTTSHFGAIAIDAGNNASDEHTLEYDGVSNAANIGDRVADQSATTVLPTAWKTSVTPGAKVLVSTGVNWVAKNTYLQIQSYHFCTTALVSNECPVGDPTYVTMQWADPAKPGGVNEFKFNNVQNLTVSGLTATGSQTMGDGTAFYLTASNSSSESQYVNFQDDSALFSQASVPFGIGSMKGIYISTSNHVNISNWTGHWLSNYCTAIADSLLNPSSYITFNGVHCRYIYQDFMSMASGSPDHVTYNDVVMIAPMRNSGAHIDTTQLGDARSPQYLTANRVLFVTADGQADAQGWPFGGTFFKGTGYIDNGTPGQPGNTLHITSNPSKYLSLGGTGVYITSTTDVGGNSITPGTRVGSTASCTNITVSNPNPVTCPITGAPQLVGSISNQVTVYSAPVTNYQVNGAIYAGSSTGWTSQGWAGTSFYKNYTQVKSNGYLNGANFAAIYLTGKFDPFVGTDGKTYVILTATAVDTAHSANFPPYAPGQTSNSHLYYPFFYGTPCVTTRTIGYPSQPLCTLTSTNQSYNIGNALGPPPGYLIAHPEGLTGNGGVGTYLVTCGGALSNLCTTTSTSAGTKFAITNGNVTSTGGPAESVQNAQEGPMWPSSATVTITSGFVWDKLQATQGSGNVVAFPSSVAISNVVQGLFSSHIYPDDYTHQCATHVFLHGDPQENLDAISPATWAAMTDSQVAAQVGELLKPAPGGVGTCGATGSTLDAGGGNAYGAVTFDSTPTWNDGSGKAIQ